jgi:ribosomal protein S18 acetylase RimI-like enzyme
VRDFLEAAVMDDTTRSFGAKCYAIESLCPGDIEKYRALRRHGLELHPEAFGETAAHFSGVASAQIVSRLQSAERRGGFILVAKDSADEFVGTVGLAVPEAEKMAHRASLWGMFVEPRARGAGLGRQLVEECLGRARAVPSLKLVTLAVVTTNEAALQLYRTVGFRVYGTDPAVLKVGERFYDEYLMVCDL